MAHSSPPSGRSCDQHLRNQRESSRQRGNLSPGSICSQALMSSGFTAISRNPTPLHVPSCSGADSAIGSKSVDDARTLSKSPIKQIFGTICTCGQRDEGLLSKPPFRSVHAAGQRALPSAKSQETQTPVL